jgi:hypothetical protein
MLRGTRQNLEKSAPASDHARSAEGSELHRGADGVFYRAAAADHYIDRARALEDERFE